MVWGGFLKSFVWLGKQVRKVAFKNKIDRYQKHTVDEKPPLLLLFFLSPNNLALNHVLNITKKRQQKRKKKQVQIFQHNIGSSISEQGNFSVSKFSGQLLEHFYKIGVEILE